MKFVDLDDARIYKKLDTSGLYQRIASLGQQCKDAWVEANNWNIPASYANVDRVVIQGMGGSAIGGDLLSDLASLEKSPPISVWRDYGLAPYVNSKTLFIASSYSGGTEETLDGFKRAIAVKAKIAAVTSGGKLLTAARNKRLPVFQIKYIGEPRTSLGYSFMPLIAIVCKLRLIKDKSKDVAEAVSLLQKGNKELSPEIPSAKNQAKKLALELHGQIVAVYGSGFLSNAARRFKGQINENSKGWAFYDLLPELDHNSIVGYEFPDGASKNTMRVIMLRSAKLNKRTLVRYDVTKKVLAFSGGKGTLLDAKGASPLAQMLNLIQLGDYTSYYLAILNGINPAPVKVIDFLKDELAKAR
ncbi:MAG: bifunctional phosphoglucose/phosphomannose isomerase [Dehalococcoidia bacterium]|nr:bifunctional phosphoglucose/phosphomannose isomerase [Dehalococcoidia bacterium]